MSLVREDGRTHYLDVLDRVLDKGIVVDAWIRVSLAGIDLVTLDGRAVVASLDTYLKFADTIGTIRLSAPTLSQRLG
jgi:hypothetical protein